MNIKNANCPPVDEKTIVSTIIDDYCTNPIPGCADYQLANFIEVLNYISAHNSTYGSLYKTEIQIIGDVWNRINSKDNIEQRDNLRQMFLNQVLDCRDIVKNTINELPLVCMTGRIARYMQTLECLDQGINAKIVDT